MGDSTQQSVEVLHTYAIEEPLYSRGLARGYRARDKQLDDHVILEIVSIRAGMQRPEFVSRYRPIVVKVMRVRHPNVVAIRDFVVHPDQYFVIKQYDAGFTLDVLLRSRGKTLERRTRHSLCKDVLRGLAALHQSDIIHRDVKAATVYVRDGPELVAQIDDFELAVSAGTEHSDSGMCGTPAYMAPEMISPPYPFSKASDVYSTGLLLLEILSGRRVYDLMRLDGLEENSVANLLQYVEGRGGHISESRIRESVAAPYADLLARATNSNPSERFPDCQAFYEAFAGNR